MKAALLYLTKRESPLRIEELARFGATHAINATREDPVDSTRAVTIGGAHKSFEAIGAPRTSDQAVRATRPGRTAVIIGALSVPLPISDINFSRKEITVIGVASRRAGDVEDVIEMARNRRIELAGLITRRYGFGEINQGLEDLQKGATSHGNHVVELSHRSAADVHIRRPRAP